MRNTAKVLAFIAGLIPAIASAQSQPNFSNLPPSIVVGRLAIGPGPAQAISLAQLKTIIGNAVGPASTTIGHLALWSNTVGTGLSDFNGTSGGIPYFNSLGSIGSSALLTQYGPMIGGGAGAAPATVAVGTNNQAFMGATGAAPGFRALVGADLPNPSASTLGGVQSITSLAHNWIAFIDTSGVPHQSQPGVGDLSGLGTGVGAALAIAVGSAGAPVVNGGVLGTPSSGTLTNTTGLPIATGVSGLGTGCATFLGTPSSANLRGCLTDEVGTGFAYFQGGALGTPASGTATNITGLPIATGISGLGTGVATAAAIATNGAGGFPTSPVANANLANASTTVNGQTCTLGGTCTITASAGSITAGTTTVTGGPGVLSNTTSGGTLVSSTTLPSSLAATNMALTTPSLGTPTSGTLTNATGLPIAGVTGWGTGVATAVGTNVGSAGAPVLLNGAGGTPSAITLTNATGYPNATNAVKGVMEGDGSTISCVAGVCTATGSSATSVTPGTTTVSGGSAVSGGVLTNTAGVLSNSSAGTLGQAFISNGGTSPPTFQSGAWVLLNTLTASSSASLSDTTHITSSYNEYLIVLENILPATNASTCQILLHNSGGTFQPSGYQVSTLGGNNAAAFSQTITTSIPCGGGGSGSNTGLGVNGEFTIFNPSTSAFHAVTGNTTQSSGAVANTVITLNVSGFWATAAVIDGYQIIMSTGNITSGTVKLYGRL